MNKQKQEKMEPVIWESWQRSISYNIHPRKIEKLIAYSKEELERAIHENQKLLEIAEPYIQNMFAIVHDMKDIYINLLDKRCYTLKNWTGDEGEYILIEVGSHPGTCWKEKYRGTNGPGTAMYLNKPVLVKGWEHFCEMYHGIACLAAPIHDPKGDILAILNIAVAADEYNKGLWGMLLTGVRGIERELQHISHQYEMEALNQQLRESVKKERRLKKEVKEKAQLIEAIIDNMYEGLLICNTDGKYVLVNESAQDLLGANSNELVSAEIGYIGSLVVFKYENEKVVPIEEYLGNRVLKGETVENQVYIVEKGRSKRYIVANGTPILDEEGKMKYALLSCTDITKMKYNELAVKKQREFVGKVLDMLGVPMAVIRYPDLICEISNVKSTDLVNQLLGEKGNISNLVGKTVEEVVSIMQNQNFIEYMIQVGESRKEIFAKAELYAHSNQYYHFIFSPIFDKKNNVSHVAVTALDVSNEVNYNKKMEEMAKQKDDFFSIVSHELRSPAALINLATQMLLSTYYEKDLSDKARKLVHKIKQNSYRLLRLVNNFLDMAKIEEGFAHIEYTNVDIVQLTKAIIDSLQLFTLDKKIKLDLYTEVNKKIIAIDTDKYEKILLNLLSNAFKFTPSDRKITVHIHLVEKYIIISVEDQGIGISQEKVDKIFDRFVQVDSSFRRKNEGTGIGLSLVKILVEKMEGKIEVHSQVGKGSCFSVYLPDRRIQEEQGMTNYIKSSSEIAEIVNIEFADIYGE
ncbi:ATP-binding protein [Clostridiaceae bacterium 35-E11]